MAETEEFADLIRRVRGGDPGAAEAVWRRFEPLLRREVRLRLRDPRLRRLFDETDVCQSVMASFFVRATAGEYELDGPEQLRRLLAQMGRNKLAGQARRHQALRRDCRRVEQLPEGEDGVANAALGPGSALAWQELLQQFREGLSEEERQLADLRAQGRAWANIAAALGGTADARRIQLNRAIARVSRALGLDMADEEPC
jgi:RNA polymerase sigma-70 factor (ECF subfamily)